MKLSIVVTVYNKEKYIRKCISSIIHQSKGLFSAIELIIVNDGSEDKSLEQIEDFIREYNNIILIDQKNEGLSLARNNGIKAAKGEYIWCIDADDWIQSNALDVLLPVLDGNTDLVKIYPILYTDSGEKCAPIPFEDICSFSGKETFRNNVAQIATSVLLVYRKQFLIKNNLWFMPKVYHEDNEFCPRVCYLSECTTVVPYHLYVIRRTDGRESITTSINPRRAYDIMKCMESLFSFNSNVVLERDIRHTINEWISVGMTTAIEIIMQSGKDEISKFNNFYFLNYRFLTKAIWDGKMKNKVEAVLFRFFPHNVVQCYEFLNYFNPNKRII